MNRMITYDEYIKLIERVEELENRKPLYCHTITFQRYESELSATIKLYSNSKVAITTPEALYNAFIDSLGGSIEYSTSKARLTFMSKSTNYYSVSFMNLTFDIGSITSDEVEPY